MKATKMPDMLDYRREWPSLYIADSTPIFWVNRGWTLGSITHTLNRLTIIHLEVQRRSSKPLLMDAQPEASTETIEGMRVPDGGFRLKTGY